MSLKNVKTIFVTGTHADDLAAAVRANGPAAGRRGEDCCCLTGEDCCCVEKDANEEGKAPLLYSLCLMKLAAKD
ncbi:metallophosphoesterase [Sesbania bispinosa]|nr:metallophosphoesterase [Sesbania bispinosa]